MKTLYFNIKIVPQIKILELVPNAGPKEQNVRILFKKHFKLIFFVFIAHLSHLLAI
jgi:hypothetical protein